METGSQPDLLAERLNTEPTIFRGYTDSELMTAIGLTAAVWVPVGVVLGLLAGSVPLGLGVAFLAIIGSIVLGASWFQAWKRGRPEFWLQQRMALLLDEYGLVQSPLLCRRGVMSLGRSGYDRPERRRRRVLRRT
jgi:conjugative transfer region protein (TIGR03750 family)